MPQFKGQKKYVPGKAVVKNTNTAAMADDLGFDDEDSDDDGDDDDGDDGDGEDDGVSFIAYLSLQKSLRNVTQQKIALADELRDQSLKLRKTEYQLNRATSLNKTQIGILQTAQKNQMGEKDGLVANAKMSLEEMEEAGKGDNGDTGPQAIKHMVDTISSLTDSKRESFEKAEMNEALLKQAQLDLVELEKISEETEAQLKAELADLRAGIDPNKLVAITQAQGSGGGASTAQVRALEKEVSDLQDKLEIKEAQQKAASDQELKNRRTSGVSSAVSDKLEADLKENKSMVAKLQAELNDTRAMLAKSQAMSAAGSEQESAAKAMQGELTATASKAKEEARVLTAKNTELQDSLSTLQAAHDRVTAQVTALQSNLDQQAAAGASSAEQLSAQLTTERANHNAVKAQCETAEAALAQSKAEVAELRESAASNIDAAEASLRAERERHASAIQAAKASAAAEIAEVKQRAQDDMKDLRQKLGSFGGIVGPMMVTLRELSQNYRKLRTETRELAATIAPAVKQAKRDLLKTLADIDRQYKEMITKYRKEMALRKKLHNELVDLKGNIRVFGRIRPIISEDGKGPQAEKVVVHDKNDDQLVHCKNKGKMSMFDLDVIFNDKSQQVDVFKACADLILSVIDGFNVCIFAYGQTGSGKTFTMEGTDEHPGLNRRALAHLFDTVEAKKADWSYELEVSVMEIYNEKLKDLLNSDKKSNVLEIKHGRAGPHVPGLTKRVVRTVDDVQKYFAEAKKTSGKLNLIDLAGSERVGKSGALNDATRLKEATNINKSLSSLGDVIHALGAKQKHVPYRNSKLTHLLQDSLGGHAKTLMVVQLSPVEKNIGESICSLNFATRVKKVELGQAKKVTESAQVAQLKKRIRELEAA